jgi:hypothetical protein
MARALNGTETKMNRTSDAADVRGYRYLSAVVGEDTKNKR